MYLYILGFTLVIIIIACYVYKEAYATKVILFHSPKCKHCTKMMPEWDNFVSMARYSLSVRAMDFNVENSDSEIEKIKDNYDISSWPTIVIIRGIKWDHYDGKLKADDIWNAVT